jgi:hypothetical protein
MVNIQDLASRIFARKKALRQKNDNEKHPSHLNIISFCKAIVTKGTGIYAEYADLPVLDTRSRIKMMRLHNTGCDK